MITGFLHPKKSKDRILKNLRVLVLRKNVDKVKSTIESLVTEQKGMEVQKGVIAVRRLQLEKNRPNFLDFKTLRGKKK